MALPHQLGSFAMAARDAGDLVSVAFANDRAEGSMIQGMLETAGIPSVLEQVGVPGPQLGFGLLNPDGGPQRVMVHAGQAEAARALLVQTATPTEPNDGMEGGDLSYVEDTGGRKPRNYGLSGAYARIWAWSFGTMALAFGVFLLLRML